LSEGSRGSKESKTDGSARQCWSARNTPLRRGPKELARALSTPPTPSPLHATAADSPASTLVAGHTSPVSTHCVPALKVSGLGRARQICCSPFLAAAAIDSALHVLAENVLPQRRLAGRAWSLVETLDVRRKRVSALLQLYPNFILGPPSL